MTGFSRPALVEDRPAAAAVAAAVVVAAVRLEPGERFVLWALRHRLREGRSATASPILARGFRRVLGQARPEPAALAAFEGLVRALRLATSRARDGEEEAAAAATLAPDFLPPRSARVSARERAVIGLLAAAQAGEGPWLELPARRLGVQEGSAARALRRRAVAFATILRRAGLALPPLPASAPFAAAAAALVLA